MNKKIIIGGGGTGGHVFPAISVAHALREIQPGIEILFVGAKDRLEMEKVPEAGFAIEGLPVTGFKRSFSIKNLRFFVNLFKSARLSRQIILRERPDAALGVGGYASGPILRAASKAGVPIVIQEQNSYAGITNRLLAHHASRICVAYEGMEKYFPADKILLTGNPVRKDIINCGGKRNEGLRHFGLLDEKPVVLIIGGSLGARTINETIGNALSELPDNIQFLWQTGKIYYQRALKMLNVTKRLDIKVLPFIKEMDLAYGCADIIVSRAGAGTISELAIAGKPVILIPSPNVAEDHQTRNAKALTEKNAALMVKDVDAARMLIPAILELNLNEELRKILAENIKKLAIPDAAVRIAKEVLKIIETK